MSDEQERVEIDIRVNMDAAHEFLHMTLEEAGEIMGGQPAGAMALLLNCVFAYRGCFTGDATAFRQQVIELYDQVAAKPMIECMAGTDEARLYHAHAGTFERKH